MYRYERYEDMKGYNIYYNYGDNCSGSLVECLSVFVCQQRPTQWCTEKKKKNGNAMRHINSGFFHAMPVAPYTVNRHNCSSLSENYTSPSRATV